MLFKVLCCAALAAALPSTHYLQHEAVPVSQRHHYRGNRIDPDVVLPVRIALTQSNLHKGEKFLLDISSPASPNYGKHWTAEQVRDTFAPSDEAIKEVSDWLVASGISRKDIHQSQNKVWLAASMPAKQAEEIFHTQYYEEQIGEDKSSITCNSYSVPRHLTKHIDYVRPGIVSAVPLTKKRAIRDQALQARDNTVNTTDISIQDQQLAVIAGQLAADSSNATENMSAVASIIAADISTCGDLITPACIQALYNMPPLANNTAVDPINALGIIEEQDVFSQSDMDIFVQLVAPSIPAGTGPTEFVSINNATATGSVGGGEAMLDYELAISLIYPLTVTGFQSDTTGEQDAALPGSSGENALWDAVDGSYCTPADVASGASCGIANLTRVISISYGGQELQDSYKSAVAACAEVMKLSLQGHTIVEATGDYGVTGNSQVCIDPQNITASANGDQGSNGTVFNTDFWSSCPWTLSVGGTQLDFNSTVNGPENSMGGSDPTPVQSRFGSNGGFSNYHKAPSYQQDALATYFSKYDPGYPTYCYGGNQSIGANGGRYNRDGRGYPDVAALGNNIFTVAGGQVGTTGGTSAAAPIVAAMIARINQARTEAGKGPVGFVQPVLYAHPEAFNDVTEGNNPGCFTSGFSAVPGWDPVTGLGSPNYAKLLDIFLSLP